MTSANDFILAGNDNINLFSAGILAFGTSQWIYSIGLLIIVSVQLGIMFMLLIGQKPKALKSCTGSVVMGLFWLVFFGRGLLEFGLTTVIGDCKSFLR
jgi:hypothetical protein